MIGSPESKQHKKCNFLGKLHNVEMELPSKWAWPTDARGWGKSPQFSKSNMNNEKRTTNYYKNDFLAKSENLEKSGRGQMMSQEGQESKILKKECQK